MVENVTKTGRREKKKQQTRARILTAAMKLFARNGFSRTSVESLAREAGVGKGTIYGYFKTKEEILLAFCEEELEFVYERLSRNTNHTVSLLEQLLNLYMGLFEYISRNPEFGRQFMREMIFPKEMTVERSRELDDRFIALVLPLLRQAQHRGELRSDVPLIFVIAQFYAQYVMAVSAWYMGRLQSEDDVRESMRILFTQTIEGLTPKEDKP